MKIFTLIADPPRGPICFILLRYRLRIVITTKNPHNQPERPAKCGAFGCNHNKESKMKLYQITSHDGLLELEVGVYNTDNQDLEGEVKCLDLNEQEWITVNGWAFEWDMIPEKKRAVNHSDAFVKTNIF